MRDHLLIIIDLGSFARVAVTLAQTEFYRSTKVILFHFECAASVFASLVKLSFRPSNENDK